LSNLQQSRVFSEEPLMLRSGATEDKNAEPPL
jgi:hypothetical protein